MSVRAKFKVTGVQSNENNTNVNLNPVISGSEENKSFWNATPGGGINLCITNPDAFNQFQVDDEFYVDFTKAD